MSWRILLVNWRDIEHPEAGGAEVHAHEIFRRIAAEGHSVTFLTCAWPGCAPEATLDGIEVLRRGSNFTFNYSVPGVVRRELAGRGYDILIEDVNKIPFRSPDFWRGPRLILFHHLFGGSIFRETVFPVASYVWLWERLIPFFYRGENTQAVSRDTAAELIGMGFDQNRMRIVYNGIESTLYTPAPEGENPPMESPYVLYMGRIKRYKRLELVLEAFSRARLDGLDQSVRLVFAGAGDDYPRLKARAGALGLTGSVDFEGRVSLERKLALLRHTLMVLNSSPKEGWGITNLEAAACGAPVIASRSPGLRESVLDGESGFLFTPGDTAEFASRIRQVAADRELRAKLGRGARAFAGQFTWENSARQTIQHISDILAGS